eukprot:3363996-Amphidinium_carterae.1
MGPLLPPPAKRGLSQNNCNYFGAESILPRLLLTSARSWLAKAQICNGALRSPFQRIETLGMLCHIGEDFRAKESTEGIKWKRISNTNVTPEGQNICATVNDGVWCVDMSCRDRFTRQAGRSR